VPVDPATLPGPSVASAIGVRAVWQRPLVVVGFASLANGLALVAHILGGVSLPGFLAVTWTSAVVAVAMLAGGAGRALRRSIVRTIGVGVAAGLLATAAYDVTKATLSLLDPSPFNPFEVTRVFGTILVGPDAPAALITATGWAFHLANGCTFAIAFACFFARDGRISMRRGILTGIGWGLFLETFQLGLYPGWLNIRFLDEFRQISFLSHVVFGAAIGILVPAGLRRSRPPSRLGEEGIG
jgi:hypothetical protein